MKAVIDGFLFRSLWLWICVLASAPFLFSCSLGGRGMTPIRSAFNKGVYHYSAGNYDEAVAEFKLALEEDEKDYRSRFNLAMVYETLAEKAETVGDDLATTRWRQRAKAEYEILLRDRPNDLRATVNLAACEYDLGAKEEGKARLLRAIDEHREYGLPRSALAARLLEESKEYAGETQRREAKLSEALELLQDALKQNPASIEANMLSGATHLELARLTQDDERQSHLEEARTAYLKGLRGKPGDIATLLALAELDREVEDRNSAIAWLQRLLYIDPDHWRAHLLLAELFEGNGNLEGATVHLWEARRLEDAEHPRVRSSEYRRRLLSLYQRLAEEEGRSVEAYTTEDGK